MKKQFPLNETFVVETQSTISITELDPQDEEPISFSLLLKMQKEMNIPVPRVYSQSYKVVTSSKLVTPIERSRRPELFHSASSGRTRLGIANHTPKPNKTDFMYLMLISELSSLFAIPAWRVIPQFRTIAVIVI
jgi:hypothetical protein